MDAELLTEPLLRTPCPGPCMGTTLWDIRFIAITRTGNNLFGDLWSSYSYNSARSWLKPQ